MSYPIVKLVFTESNDYEYETIKVYVDDKLIGEGVYGGEPEDNSRSRDYGWVETIIENLAKELGATVITE